MSFAVENLSSDLNRLNFSTPHGTWLSGNQRTSNRNLQCVSSDDEEDDEELVDSEDEDEDDGLLTKPAMVKKKSNVPLPSDEEGIYKKGERLPHLSEFL